MEKDRFKELVNKYQNGSLRQNEFKELREFLADSSQKELLENFYDQLPVDNLQIPEYQKNRVFEKILKDQRIVKSTSQKTKLRTHLFRYAALILSFITLAYLLYLLKPKVEEVNTISTKVLPGYDRALIELNDGHKLQLDSLSDVKFLNEKGFYLTKQDKYNMLFKYNPKVASDKSGFHTLSTPKGGQFKLELPDGTKIWMNAESSLQFAGNFGEISREIICEGEVYFEVAKKTIEGKAMPFTVSTKGQLIHVLGTIFNVNSYNEQVITTLVEGKVYLTDENKKSVFLAPAQQAIYQEEFTIQDVDPLYAVAWKDGDFAFRRSTITEVMQSISRWYDVQVVYEGNFDKDVFTGTISRYEDIDKLLNTMEFTGSFHFKREGRTIFVTK